MNTKHKTRLASGLAVVALQFLLAGTAAAHEPLISATAVCDENNELVIQYTADGVVVAESDEAHESGDPHPRQ